MRPFLHTNLGSKEMGRLGYSWVFINNYWGKACADLLTLEIGTCALHHVKVLVRAAKTSGYQNNSVGYKRQQMRLEELNTEQQRNAKGGHRAESQLGRPTRRNGEERSPSRRSVETSFRHRPCTAAGPREAVLPPVPQRCHAAAVAYVVDLSVPSHWSYLPDRGSEKQNLKEMISATVTRLRIRTRLYFLRSPSVATPRWRPIYQK